MTSYTKFTSNQGWVSFYFPSHLECTQEHEGTYLFYTENTGSFRVTPLSLEGENTGDFDHQQYLQNISSEYWGEVLGGLYHDYAYYVSSSRDDDNDLTIYNWVFAIENKIVVCTYTIDTDSINGPEIISEKAEIYRIIDNLSLTDYKPDFSSPQRAIISLEYYYSNKDLSGVISCKNFEKEAENILKKRQFPTDELKTEMAGALKTFLIDHLNLEGFPDFSNANRVFRLLDEKKDERQILIEEKLIFPDGTIKMNSFWLWQDEAEQWKVLNMID